MNPIRLTVPLPPSTNHYWRFSRNGNYLTAQAQQYKAQVQLKAALAHKAKPMEGPVVVHMDVYRQRRIGDLENFQKVLLDSLQGTIYRNDSQIVEIHARRFDDKKNPRVELVIQPAEAEQI